MAATTAKHATAATLYKEGGNLSRLQRERGRLLPAGPAVLVRRKSVADHVPGKAARGLRVVPWRHCASIVQACNGEVGFVRIGIGLEADRGAACAAEPSDNGRAGFETRRLGPG